MTTVQDARVALAVKVREFEPKWAIRRTWFEAMPATHTAEVGHAAPVFEQFGGEQVALPLILWVNEGNADASIGMLYAAITHAPDSLVERLRAVGWVRHVTVDFVGPRADGPTGYTVADLTVTVSLAKLSEAS